MGSSEREGPRKDQRNQRLAYFPDFHPQAEEELVLAVADYEAAQEGLGARFHDAVQQQIEKIIDNPFLYPAVTIHRRKATMDRFPFCIYYLVWKRKKIVTILSIHHAKRRPSNWRQRNQNWRT
jgi:hypothetical protein